MTKKKVLLIGIDTIVEPLGLMYITAALKQGGNHVDLELIKEKTDISDIKLKSGYDFVGFSVLTGNHKRLLKLSQRYREAGVKTIVGGPHATFFANETLPFADFVVVGEGIKAVLDVVNGGARPGIVRTDLTAADEFPFADREELYKDPKKLGNRIKNLLTGFGCPFSCNYCCNSAFNRMFPRFLRQRSVDNVIQEAKKLLKYRPLELIFFQEDYFGMNLSWLKEFAEKWPREINIPFHCQIRPEFGTEKRLKLLKKAGCHGISVGIETMNEKLRRKILGRGGTNKQITEGCLRIKKFGFKLRTFEMIGLPFLSIQDDLETLKFNCLIQPNFARAEMYLPLRFSVLGELCIKEGLWDGSEVPFEGKELSMDSESVLNYDPEHKKKLLLLQKIFHLAAHLPYGDKIAKEFIAMENPKLDDFLSLVRKYMMDGLYL
jgi:radical SAM superfamily enzyme YgiQ (UPF0313 family)